MKYGRTLTFLLLAGLSISLYYFALFIREFPHRSAWLQDVNWGWVIVGLVVHMSAHMLRAAKSKLLLDPIRQVSFWNAFRSMAIGFLHNTILPFRLGELVRAHTLGRLCFISRTSIVLTILFERAVDGLVLSTGTLFITLALPSSLGRDLQLLALPVLASVLIIMLFFGLMKAQPTLLLKWVSRTTGLFNDKIRDQLRFTAWSAGYSVQLIVAKARFRLYLGLSVMMWLLYGGAIWCLLRAFHTLAGRLPDLAIIGASYLAVSVPSGPAYVGTYHFVFTNIARAFLSQDDALLGLSLLSWAFLMIPVSLVGFYCLLRLRINIPDPGLGDSDPRANKLYRHTDVSADISDFLEAYFDDGAISKVLSASELKDDFRLVRLLQGGSNAATVLARDQEGIYVRKLTLARHSSKLERQYEWLKKHQGYSYYPRLIKEGHTNVAYFYDLEFAEGYSPFFDYIHDNDIEYSKDVIQAVLNTLANDLYHGGKPVYSPAKVREYIDIKVRAKVEDTCAMSTVISGLAAHSKLIVNSVEFDNLTVALERITNDPEMMEDLSNFIEVDIHGDLTVDNLLIRKEAFILLDPNDENLISDMLVDIAKLYQSLHSGYEFLRLLTATSAAGNTVSFSEKISSKYVGLYLALNDSMRNQLPKHRYRSILFHEAVHYCRMLTYRVRINEDTAPAFYAVAVRLLNQFAAQYDGSTI